MKKSNRVIVVMCIGALLAVGSASCKKNDTTKTSSFTFELPAVEGFSAEEGKAYIDIAASSQMKWWDGDKIKVYSVDATNTTPVTADFTAEAGCSGKTVAKFTGEDLTKGSYGYFAFYPYDKAVSVAKNKTEFMKINSEIEKKYQQNLLEINNKNSEQIKENNKTLKRRIELINSDLNRK